MARAMKLPLLSMDAMVVAPYLNKSLPPDSSTVKLVVKSLGVLAAVPVVFWFKVGNVQFAKFPEVGVPSKGVTNVGLVAKTTAPEPVLELRVMFGVVPPLEARGEEAVTLVTVPPEPVAAMVWLGQEPVIVTPEPCTKPGVAVAVPPLAIGKMPVTPVVKGKPVALVNVTD